MTSKTLQKQRAALERAGYTIHATNPGSPKTTWYALPPGVTKFFDNFEKVADNPEIKRRKNYLGVYASLEDLITEVYRERLHNQPESAKQEPAPAARPRATTPVDVDDAGEPLEDGDSDWGFLSNDDDEVRPTSTPSID